MLRSKLDGDLERLRILLMISLKEVRLLIDKLWKVFY